MAEVLLSSAGTARLPEHGPRLEALVFGERKGGDPVESLRIFEAAFRALRELTPASRARPPSDSRPWDLVLVGGNRTELTFTATASYRDRAALSAAERRLLRCLLIRTQA